MTAWCLSVIAELALSPPQHVIDGVHPPDECVSLRQPALKDPWRIRERPCLASRWPPYRPVWLFPSAQLPTASLAHTNASKTDTIVHRYAEHKAVIMCLRLDSHYCMFVGDQRGNKSFKGSVYLICGLLSRSSFWLALSLTDRGIFSAPLSLLHCLSPRGLWSQALWQDPNLENEMKCSSVCPIVDVFQMWGRWEG